MEKPETAYQRAKRLRQEAGSTPSGAKPEWRPIVGAAILVGLAIAVLQSDPVKRALEGQPSALSLSELEERSNARIHPEETIDENPALATKLAASFSQTVGPCSVAYERMKKSSGDQYESYSILKATADVCGEVASSIGRLNAPAELGSEFGKAFEGARGDCAIAFRTRAMAVERLAKMVDKLDFSLSVMTDMKERVDGADARVYLCVSALDALITGVGGSWPKTSSSRPG